MTNQRLGSVSTLHQPRFRGIGFLRGLAAVVAVLSLGAATLLTSAQVAQAARATHSVKPNKRAGGYRPVVRILGPPVTSRGETKIKFRLTMPGQVSVITFDGTPGGRKVAVSPKRFHRGVKNVVIKGLKPGNYRIVVRMRVRGRLVEAKTSAFIGHLAVAPPVGQIGPMGPQGVGVPGKDGVDGRPGTDGRNGTNGTAGRDGADGVNGIDGAPGRNGLDGAPGRDGAAVNQDFLTRAEGAAAETQRVLQEAQATLTRVSEESRLAKADREAAAEARRATEELAERIRVQLAETVEAVGRSVTQVDGSAGLAAQSLASIEALAARQARVLREQTEAFETVAEEAEQALAQQLAAFRARIGSSEDLIHRAVDEGTSELAQTGKLVREAAEAIKRAVATADAALTDRIGKFNESLAEVNDVLEDAVRRAQGHAQRADLAALETVEQAAKRTEVTADAILHQSAAARAAQRAEDAANEVEGRSGELFDTIRGIRDDLATQAEFNSVGKCCKHRANIDDTDESEGEPESSPRTELVPLQCDAPVRTSVRRTRLVRGATEPVVSGVGRLAEMMSPRAMAGLATLEVYGRDKGSNESPAAPTGAAREAKDSVSEAKATASEVKDSKKADDSNEDEVDSLEKLEL